jgi:hypothetical protein
MFRSISGNEICSSYESINGFNSDFSFRDRWMFLV